MSGERVYMSSRVTKLDELLAPVYVPVPPDDRRYGTILAVSADLKTVLVRWDDDDHAWPVATSRLAFLDG